MPNEQGPGSPKLTLAGARAAPHTGRMPEEHEPLMARGAAATEGARVPPREGLEAPKRSAKSAGVGHRVVLVGWFVVLSLVSASLLVRHVVALPAPKAQALTAAFATFRPGASVPGAGSEPLALVHVLYAECRCSARVAEHLVSKPRPADVVEHVLLVGEDEALAAKLSTHGFVVKKVSREELAAWGVEAAPLFVVVSAAGAVRYAGGYTERKQGLLPRDREIVGALREGRKAATLPIFGCAVSDGLERTVNPLRLP